MLLQVHRPRGWSSSVPRAGTRELLQGRVLLQRHQYYHHGHYPCRHLLSPGPQGSCHNVAIYDHHHTHHNRLIIINGKFWHHQQHPLWLRQHKSFWSFPIFTVWSSRPSQSLKYEQHLNTATTTIIRLPRSTHLIIFFISQGSSTYFSPSQLQSAYSGVQSGEHRNHHIVFVDQCTITFQVELRNL